MFLNIRKTGSKKLFVLLFVIALASGFFWNHRILGEPISSDQVIYDGIALDILNKGTFTDNGEETSSEPVYPLFLAGIYKIFGHNHIAVQSIQIILFALIACMVFRISRPLMGDKAAFGAGILTSLFYPLANQAGLLLQETLFTFLLICFVSLLHQAENKAVKWWFFSGIFLGLATLTKGSIQFLFLFIIGYVLFILWKRVSFRKLADIILIFMLGFLIITGPWIAREKLMGGSLGVAPRGGGTLLILTEITERMSQNYLGNFIGFSLGYYFAQKLYPDIDPVAFRDFSSSQQRINDLAQEKSLREVDAIFLEEAKDYIIHNPHKYAYMAVLNLINLNSPIIIKGPLWQNVTAIHPMFADGRHPELPELIKAMIVLGIRVVWFALFFFIAYGMWIHKRNLRPFGWILLLILYLNVFYSLVWTVPRYALPMYPFYFILAMPGIFLIWGKIKARLRLI